MKKNLSLSIGILFLWLTLCVGFMTLVEVVFMPGYLLKSLCKVILFAGLPALLFWIKKENPLPLLFKGKRIFLCVLPGLGVGALIFFAYLLLRDILPLENVSTALKDTQGITPKVYPFVAIYIPVVNAFLEETFFRGLGVLLPVQKGGKKGPCMLFSSFLFALYHVGIMVFWLPPAFLFLLIVGLFAAGLLFSCLALRAKNIWMSYFLHMGANLGINMIGVFLIFQI